MKELKITFSIFSGLQNVNVEEENWNMDERCFKVETGCY